MYVSVLMCVGTYRRLILLSTIAFKDLDRSKTPHKADSTPNKPHMTHASWPHTTHCRLLVTAHTSHRRLLVCSAKLVAE